jgi:hypothetical protein
VDDCEGLGAALDAAMQASVDATYDPWKEATAPKTVNQFISVIAIADIGSQCPQRRISGRHADQMAKN